MHDNDCCRDRNLRQLEILEPEAPYLIAPFDDTAPVLGKSAVLEDLRCICGQALCIDARVDRFNLLLEHP